MTQTHRSFFKHDLPSRVDTAKAKKRESDANQREVYRLVTIRDQGRCRVCGKACSPYAVSMLDKAHHHHIVFRSQGGQDTTAGICLVDAGCHDAVHVKRTLAIEGNADIALTISKRDSNGEFFVWRQETAVGIYERD